MSRVGDLQAALKTKLETVLGGGWAVVVRKQASRIDGDPDKLCVVSIGPDRWEPATGEDDFFYFTSYPVSFVLSDGNPGTVKPQESLQLARQTVVRAVIDIAQLWGVLPGLDGAEYSGKPFAGPQGTAKGVDVSSFGVTYRFREARV